MKNSESGDRSLDQNSNNWEMESRSLTSPPQDGTNTKTQLILYLIPVMGFFPSLWTIYRRQGSREQLAVSRLSITLALTWLLSYTLLATGVATADAIALRMLILNSFCTSGYFLLSLWLMFRIIKGKSYRVPGLSNLAEKLF